MNGPDEWITLARVVRPQGRFGEVLADLLTDFPEQFATGAISLLFTNGDRQGVTVEGHWAPTGRNARRVVLKLAGIDSISHAETLSGCSLQLPADQRVALNEGTYYVSDLIGCVLMDGETMLGTVSDLQFPLHASSGQRLDIAPLFVVQRSDGDEVLVPFATAFVRRIDTRGKVIQMMLPHGLIDLNG